MTKEMHDKFKRKIFEAGVDAIEELLGCDLEFKTDNAMSKAMDKALNKMSEEDAIKLCKKYYK